MVTDTLGGPPSSEDSEPRPCGGASENDLANIHVSNSDGYLCHIHCTVVLPSSPRTVFAILTNPDNTAIFRDIKAVGYRKVLQDEDGFKVIEVEQQGEFRILFKKHMFSTYLTVTEDCRNPAMLMTSFSLIRSDVLAKFQGTWQLKPLHEDCFECCQTFVELEQDVLPIGVPEFIKSMPVIGKILKGICRRAVQRLLEDVRAVIEEINKGASLEDVLPSSPSACKNGNVDRLRSHAIVNLTDSDEEA